MSLSTFHPENPPAPAGAHPCGRCRWFVPDVDHVGGTMGYCRNRAPVVFVNPSTYVRHSMWPEVNSDQWCGQFADRMVPA